MRAAINILKIAKDNRAAWPLIVPPTGRWVPVEVRRGAARYSLTQQISIRMHQRQVVGMLCSVPEYCELEPDRSAPLPVFAQIKMQNSFLIAAIHNSETDSADKYFCNRIIKSPAIIHQICKCFESTRDSFPGSKGTNSRFLTASLTFSLLYKLSEDKKCQKTKKLVFLTCNTLKKPMTTWVFAKASFRTCMSSIHLPSVAKTYVTYLLCTATVYVTNITWMVLKVR